MVITLCDRFHKLPSEVLAEPVELLRWLTINAASRDPDKEEKPQEPLGPMTISGVPAG